MNDSTPEGRNFRYKRFDEAVELYNTLKSCKEGNCYACNRAPDGSNTYPCEKQLKKDCFDWFDKFIEESEGEGNGK